MLKNEVKKLLPNRRQDSHKGDFGRVLVVGGSPGMTGAVILAGRSALRAGAGLVYLGVPKDLQNFVDIASLETITIGIAEIKLEKLEPDAILVGPGLSLQVGSPALVKNFLTQKKPLIIDADGLNSLSLAGPDALKQKNCEVILTPHPGEMARLLDTSIAQVQKDRTGIAGEFAKEYQVIVVLKGHRTVVVSPDGKIYINKTGNPGMASGGVGDVLSGMMAGLAGQGLKPWDAARLSVFLHGASGDLAAKSKGEYSLIASDIIEALPEAMRKYLR